MKPAFVRHHTDDYAWFKNQVGIPGPLPKSPDEKRVPVSMSISGKVKQRLDELVAEMPEVSRSEHVERALYQYLDL